MGLIYISLKNIGNRKATGTYYTLEKIVENLNNKLFEKEKINEKRILDIKTTRLIQWNKRECLKKSA